MAACHNAKTSGVFTLLAGCNLLGAFKFAGRGEGSIGKHLWQEARLSVGFNGLTRRSSQNYPPMAYYLPPPVHPHQRWFFAGRYQP